MSQVDLICLGIGMAPASWPLGRVYAVAPSPEAVCTFMSENLGATSADAWLFWDPGLGEPDPGVVRRVLDSPGDVWHAGLRLGMGGLPALIDTVSPVWMLNRDPDASVEATSWRISLRACLIRTDVLRQMGGVFPQFSTLDAAALEMGHRFVSRGVLLRHVPDLAPGSQPPAGVSLPFEDEMRFVHYRLGTSWSRWALLRAASGGYAGFGAALGAYRRVRAAPRPGDAAPYKRPPVASPEPDAPSRVTVLIPTVDRYPYLRVLLEQLRAQTVAPYEIVIIDQSARERRDTSIASDFADLPIHLIHQDIAGQCASRNAGLEMARGDYVLFVDDDDEVQPTLIEDHLRALRASRNEVSCGVADEVGAGPLPREFTYQRMADVFPTNNSMVARGVLVRSGLFDLAYNRGQRADRDLGMRVYLSGAMMILHPDISVLHHHAPAGGLRMHRARVITYASSRNKLVHRQLPSATEMYLAQRYFTARQLRESVWLSLLGTFSVRGSRYRKMAKVLVSFFCLPNSLYRIRKSYRISCDMMQRFPRIPPMPAQDPE